MAPTKKTHLKNKDYCKRYRNKDATAYCKNDSERKKQKRLMVQLQDPARHEMLKLKNRLRMRLAREAKKESQVHKSPAAESLDQSTEQGHSSAFSCKQSLCRSVKRVEQTLPNSPNKKTEIIGSLAKRYQIRMSMRSKRGRKRKGLTEEQTQWIHDFLERPDITYTTPGKNDHIYTGKINGQSQYVQKQYLLWTLRDLLDVVNGCPVVGVTVEGCFEGAFGRKLSFNQLYNFLKYYKQYIWNRDIPHSTCLCEICENVCMLTSGFNKSLKIKLPTNPHDLVESYACDSSKSDCMFGLCTSCQNPPNWNSKSIAETDVETDSEKSSSDDMLSSSSEEGNRSVSYYKWTKVDKKAQKIRITVDEEEAEDAWSAAIVTLKAHIYRKREQVDYYNQLKSNLSKNECIIHVDYSESYSNQQQNEIQSAYFRHTNFSLFTACGYYRNSATEELVKVPMTLVSEASDQSRTAACTCIMKVIGSIEERMPIANPLLKVHIWSDGCAAQFRSRYVFANKFIQWHYNEAHHGKGPMDGIGGTLKNTVFRAVKSGRIVIAEPFEFVKHANDLIPSVTTMYLPETDIIVKPEEINDAPAIPGTLECHKVERQTNSQGVVYLDFFKLSSDREPFFTQYYRKHTDPVVCGHRSSGSRKNVCSHCNGRYKNGEEWLECPICKQWYHEPCFAK